MPTMGQSKSTPLTASPNNTNNNHNHFAVLATLETSDAPKTASTTPQGTTAQSTSSMEVDSKTELHTYAELENFINQRVAHYLDNSVTKPAHLFNTNITTQHLLELPPDWIYRLTLSDWCKEIIEAKQLQLLYSILINEHNQFCQQRDNNNESTSASVPKSL
ncbi:hypothetical protein BDC45DRAFT_538479 [Circinella umbellata]|nr:hypothetical protein BDC45DRAFT_538479 [Circinella umbellata]